MAQTPARDATHPLDRPHRAAPLTPPPASAEANLSTHPPAAALIADTDSLQANAVRTRLCVLCGRPLRAGQHILRVHGSTIHARCTNTGR
jgi:hypothetical protein